MLLCSRKINRRLHDQICVRPLPRLIFGPADEVGDAARSEVIHHGNDLIYRDEDIAVKSAFSGHQCRSVPPHVAPITSVEE